MPAAITKVFGTQSVNVHVLPRGPTWHQHIDQLHPCYGEEKDACLGEPLICPAKCPNLVDGPGNAMDKNTGDYQAKQLARRRRNPRLPLDNQYGPHNPRCSEWLQHD